MTKQNCTRLLIKAQHDQKTLDFIERSKAIHGDNFNYDKAVYVNQKIRITLKCNVCATESGVLTCNHIYNRSGCRNCSLNSYRWTNEDFEKKSRKIHGDTYDYSTVNYIDQNEKVAITCYSHGVFWAIPNNHVRGSGCPDCARSEQGWTKTLFEKKCIKNNNGLGILYVIKCSLKDEVFYKVGITSRSVKERYASRCDMPYDYEVVHKVEDSPKFIHQLESLIHNKLHDYNHLPFTMFKGGQKECFTTIKPVEAELKRLEASRQLKLLA